MFSIKKQTQNKIVQESNNKIRAIVKEYFINYPDMTTYSKAVGAYSLACVLCETLQIDVMEIEKPEVFLAFLKKEKQDLKGGYHV